MKYVVSCPSKTFLLGEYLVLNEGMALVMSTLPRFEMHVETQGEGMIDGFVPESPAGQWIRQNKLVFRNIDLSFVDPHNGQGGFGASSAQYLLTHVVTQILKKSSSAKPFHVEDFKIEQIWRAYRQLESVSAEGLRPSGADLVGQYVGELCRFQMEPFHASGFKWPFVDHDIVLVRTGAKVPTHEHLRGLKRLDTEELAWVYARAIETLNVKDAPAFFDSVNDYYAELLEMGLVAEKTQVIVTSLFAKPYVSAAKGCGALGSDVIAVFVAKEHRHLLDKYLHDLKLTVVADTSSFDKGLSVEMPQMSQGVSLEH